MRPPTYYWRVLLALVVLLFNGGWQPAIADAVEEYTAKSVLALNLARYSDWPPEAFDADSATVNLCLLGDAVVQQAFALIDKKQVGNKNLAVNTITDSKQLDHCQLLYVSADARQPSTLFSESNARHILTLGETDDFLVQGGMVYLEMVDAKITLHVNLAATQKAGVQISSRVLKLAKIVNP